MRYLSILSFLISIYIGCSAENKYPVSAIPDSLKIDVDVVVREESRTFKILTRSTASEFTHYAYTVLNERGKYYASEAIFYDKLRKIRNIDVFVYDANGKLMKKLKSSEIADQSAVGDGTLYGDSRVKTFDMNQSTYPYSVEVNFQIDYQFLFYIPGVEQSSSRVSSQPTSYIIQFPVNSPDLAPRFKLINLNQQPAKHIQDGFEIWTWNFNSHVPTKREPLSAPADQIAPQIEVAPSSFEYDGYVGTMKTWDEFGKWIGSLNKGRNILPDETKQKVIQLTSGLSTTEDKVRAIYSFLQSKTRYVSIQLGIGGYQPFEASLVDKVGYGDCKALSNYMVSLLDVVGIKGVYTLIRAGRNGSFVTDFPSTQFNHATVFVPNKSDTIWLECTSQTAPFGYAGGFTGDRKALAITDEGAKIVWTPKYPSQLNVESRIAEVSVDANGNATANVKSTYAGLQYEKDGLEFVLDKQYDDQKKWIQKNTNIPTFDLNKFSLTNRKERIPVATVNLELTLNRFASTSGKRMFLTPNLMNRSTYVPEKVELRKTSVVRQSGYNQFDTIRYHLPDVLYPEFLPTPLKMKTRFGEYEATFKLDQGSVLYTRKLIMNKGVFPADSYNELIDFFKGINKADNIKLVFLNKT